MSTGIPVRILFAQDAEGGMGRAVSAQYGTTQWVWSISLKSLKPDLSNGAT